jgi:hypothetical protein
LLFLILRDVSLYMLMRIVWDLSVPRRNTQADTAADSNPRRVTVPRPRSPAILRVAVGVLGRAQSTRRDLRAKPLQLGPAEDAEVRA